MPEFVLEKEQKRRATSLRIKHHPALDWHQHGVCGKILMRDSLVRFSMDNVRPFILLKS